MRERMRPLLPGSIAGLLLLLGALCCASNAPDPDAARRLYELSGLEAHVAGAAEAIRAAVTQQLEQTAAGPVAGALGRIQSAFAPSQLEATVLHQLEQRYDPKFAAASVTWLASELGRRITREDVDSATLAGGARLSEFAASLRSEPPSKSRVELARRFGAVSDISDFHIDLAVATSVAVATVLNETLPEAQRRSSPEIRNAIEGRLGTLRPMLGSMATLAFLYSVRDLSDAEVSRYIDFAESKAGRWYHRTTFRAYLAAITAAAERISEGGAAARRRARSNRA